MDSTPTPTDAMSPNGDASQATDRKIDKLERDIGSYSVHEIEDEVIERMFERLSASETRNAELERELTALRKDVATVGQSDRECLMAVKKAYGYSFLMEETETYQAGTIAAHVASRLAPVQAHLRHCVDMIQWMSGSNDFTPEGQAHAGWQRMFPGYEAARAFLTRHQRDNQTGGGRG